MGLESAILRVFGIMIMQELAVIFGRDLESISYAEVIYDPDLSNSRMSVKSSL
jgi:hypothetical protein